MFHMSPAQPPERPMKLMLILGSVRPKRIGLSVALWAHEFVSEVSDVEIHFVDLTELGLPFMDEPHHPMHMQYTKRHTKAWSAKVSEADAFLIISPECNYGYSPALKNALDFLHHEWAGKPVGFISYGGLAGGTHGVAALGPVLTSLQLVSTQTHIAIQDVAAQVHDGTFVPSASQRSDLSRVVTELRWLRPTVPNDARSLAHAVS